MEDGDWVGAKDLPNMWGSALTLPIRQTRRAAFVRWIARALGVSATVEGEWVDGRRVRFRLGSPTIPWALPQKPSGPEAPPET